MAWVTPTNVATGDVLTASAWNQSVVANTIALARGYIGKSERTSGNQTGITSTTDILTNSGTSLGVTWTAESTRVYKTTLFIGYAEQQTAANYVNAVITDVSNVVKASATTYQVASGGDSLIVIAIETGLSGSVTRKGRAGTGGNTLIVSASATNPVFLVVEDIGAA